MNMIDMANIEKNWPRQNHWRIFMAFFGTANVSS